MLCHFNIIARLLQAGKSTPDAYLVPVSLPPHPPPLYEAIAARQSACVRQLRLSVRKLLLISIRGQIISSLWQNALPKTWWHDGVIVCDSTSADENFARVHIRDDQTVTVFGYGPASLPIVLQVCELVQRVLAGHHLTEENDQLELFSMCAHCTKGQIKKSVVDNRLNKLMTKPAKKAKDRWKCDSCEQKCSLFSLSWQLGPLFLTNSLPVRDLLGAWDRMPLHWRAESQDCQLLHSIRGQLSQDNIQVLERIGRMKAAVKHGDWMHNHAGCNSAVYSARFVNVAGLQNPNRLYAIKILTNPLAGSGSFDIALQKAMADSAQEFAVSSSLGSEYTTRVITHFVIQTLKTKALPEWDHSNSSEDEPAGVIVLDLFCPQGDESRFGATDRMLQFAMGLDVLQQRQVCHRDLKADNVLLDCTANWLSIIDFGEAIQCDAQFMAEQIGGLRCHLRCCRIWNLCLLFRVRL
eukprot:TRINITY_DN1343_c0_g1_i3.p1 TRINITY_DN1343_c0_g1~~TRINITY_DN1343_c0_g1_i3.p1  ORF type:complete len:466 (+),score=87.21 TRINITY_DN1343_c0_g1_i3:1094-2491(+)